MKPNVVKLNSKDEMGQLNNLSIAPNEIYEVALLEGVICKGDILTRNRYDKQENIAPNEIYELVIESNPKDNEIIVIRQFSNGHVARTQYKGSESLELINLDRYTPGSTEYESWKRKLQELEIWEDKK